MEETLILDQIRKGNQDAFRIMFDEYFTYLSGVARSMLGSDTEGCEEVVQQAFIQFWNKRTSVKIETNLKGYLKRMVINYSLKQLKARKTTELPEDHTTANFVEESIMADDLYSSYKNALQHLPEKCRETFVLSRSHGKNYKEIAEEMNVSVKTVENQMSKALKILRIQLREFINSIFF
jgi:RNA polymerase sigma-70 factor (ECF subfamily)